MEPERVMGATLRLLQERPDLAETLHRITEWEKAHYGDEFFKLGFEWKNFEPPIRPQVLHMLHLRGILSLVYDSSKHKGYLTAEPVAVIKALQVFEGMQRVVDYTPEEGIPEDLFEPIVGYDDVKRMIQRSIDLDARVHWLFVGPPASAKTLFLLCLERLPASGYLLGSRMSKAGLSDYLISFKPKFLLVDEVDKLPARDLVPLLSLCETGRVIETLYGRRREEQLSTLVFAAANTLKGLPPEFLSRFEVLHFKEYTWPQFVEVCKRLLAREGIDADLANYIAGQVWKTLRAKDVREAIRISRLSKTRDEVDDLVQIIRKYQPNKRRR